MIYLNVLLKVKNPSDVAQIRDLLTEQGRLSRAEEGCERFEVYHSETDPTRFVLNECWASQAALDAHRKGEAYTQIYQPKVLPLVEREGHPSQLLN